LSGQAHSVAELERKARNQTNEAKCARDSEYVDWAQGKADWVDPIVAREDLVLGERWHVEEEEGQTEFWDPKQGL